jgi:hypothetical protein
MISTLSSQHLSQKDIQLLVKALPDYVLAALQDRSQELDCPIEATIEMAIASFLDTEAFSFEDCLLSQREPHKVA